MRIPEWGRGVRHRLGLIAAGVIISLFAAQPALAQRMPSPTEQEVLIKNSLLAFNDANITGNFTVFHARLSKPFREQFSPERLKEIFKAFGDNRIDFDVIAAMKPIMTEEPKIDERNALLLRGYFDTKPSRVNFVLDYLLSDGEWKLIKINVDVRPPT